MKNSKVAVIAKKEFLDSMKSRTFLIIFGIFLLLMTTSLVTGVNNYNNQLDQYQRMQAVNQNIEANSVFTSFPQPKLTSVVFQQMVTNIGIIGSILAIILGYNAVSGERERGNLKLLLSYPLYREDVINGKFIGKIGVLVLTLIITSIMSISVALMMGMNFTWPDFVAIMVLMVVSIVYLVTFLGISIFFSTISRDGARSMLNSFMFWIISAMVITSFSGVIANAIVPVDDPEYYDFNGKTIVIKNEKSFKPASVSEGENTYDKLQKRWKIQNMIESLVSPTQNYEQIARAVLGDDGMSSMMGSSSVSPQSELSMSEILLGKIGNIITMLVWAIVSLVATYVFFMRQDVR